MRTAALLVITGAAAANGLRMEQIAAWRQALFLVLAVAAYVQGRHFPVRGGGVLMLLVALVPAGYAVFDLASGSGALLALGVFVTLPWLAGRFRGQQAALVTHLEREQEVLADRARLLEREQEVVADRARLLERARIAADMHDALGHELALISLRAGALELAPDLTERNREAVAELRAAAVTAADRLRHTVTGLRDTPLDTLVGRARGAGMTVRVTGSAPTNRHVHRVVQEALTNAARHAPGAEVQIRLDRTDSGVAVTVRNALGGARPFVPGNGIAGLREHVEAAGGILAVQAGTDTFTLTARLPLDGASR